MVRISLTLGLVFLTACSSPTEVDPPDPPVTPTVSSVTVTSPIGGIIAVGGSVQLSASASDASGQPITATFTWTAGDGSVASVTPAGVVTGSGAGATDITASASGVNGSVSLTVADADLGAIAALLDDPMANAMLSAVGGSAETAFRTTWQECATGRSSGNLEAVRDCITQARADLALSSEAPKRALVTLLGLFVDWIERLLNLP
jgi:hypothetical protein